MAQYTLKRKSIRHTTPEKRKSKGYNATKETSDNKNNNNNNNNNNNTREQKRNTPENKRKSTRRIKNIISSKVYDEQIQEVQIAVLGDHQSGKSSFITNCVIDRIQYCSSYLPSEVNSPLSTSNSSLATNTASNYSISEEESSDLNDWDHFDDVLEESSDLYRKISSNMRKRSSRINSPNNSSTVKSSPSSPASIPQNVTHGKIDDPVSSPHSDLETLTRTVSEKNLRRKSRLLVELNNAVDSFNAKPQNGMEYLSSLGIMSSNEAAQFLFHTASISPRAIGIFLGQNNAQIEAVRYEYVNMFEFRDKTYEESLRYFLANVSLPSESQQILRILENFGEVIAKQNNSQIKGAPFTFNAETAYFLAFEILMLHSRIHKKSDSNRKIRRKEFIEKVKFINQEIPKWWSTAIFKDILRSPLRDPTMNPILKDGFSNPVYRRKFQYGPLVIDLCISEMSLAESINLDYSSFDGFIVLFDITGRHSFETAKRFLKGIVASRSSSKSDHHRLVSCSTMLIGCKADRDDLRQVSHSEALQAAKDASIEYMEVSNASPTFTGSFSSTSVSSTSSSSSSSSLSNSNKSLTSPEKEEEESKSSDNYSSDRQQQRVVNQPVTALETLAFNISEERMNLSSSNRSSARQSCSVM